MDVQRKNSVLVILAVAVVVALISLIRVTVNVKKYKGVYQEQVAQRLDVEEKMMRLEKEYSRVISELDSVRNQLAQSKEEIDSLKSKLAEEEDEKSEAF